MDYKPNFESLKKHQVPDWFHDAKFGIFIHWGIYSVPAYGEWYLDYIKFVDGDIRKYHEETYGKDYSYDNFVQIFNEEIKKWNPEEMAEFFKKVHARYVVLTSKHHDGFLLWPSDHPNYKKETYMASRDIVGELTAAVKSRDMEMGFYYSGIYDWSIKHEKAKNLALDLLNRKTSKKYAEYATSHWLELIDKYKPKILWSDIGFPDRANIYEIFSHFYNNTPDGVINDRWFQIKKWMRIALSFPPVRWIFNRIIRKYQKAEKAPPSDLLNLPVDFLTPEYTSFNFILKRKWETNRGMAGVYGYNKFEKVEDQISVKELIHLFVDIVSKNGNLLLNVGPKADGSIPEIQRDILLEFGKWLDVNGDAIFGTRPWKRAEGKNSDGIDMRFTKKENILYAILLGKPEGDIITIKSLNIEEGSKIELLGHDRELSWQQDNNNLKVSIPNNLNDSYAFSIRIEPLPKE